MERFSAEEPRILEGEAVFDEAKDLRLMRINNAFENAQRLENEPVKALAQLQDELKGFPEYQLYLEEPIKFETLDTLLTEFNRKKSRSKDFSDDQKTLAFMIQDVKDQVRWYSDIVRKFEHANLKLHKTADRETAEETREKDQSRKIAHDALIDKLKILDRYCKALQIGEDQFFSEATLDNRDKIAEWALTVDSGEKIEAILKTIEENKKAE